MAHCSNCNEPNNPMCAMNMFYKSNSSGNCYTRSRNCFGASNCVTTECRDKPCRKYACCGPSCSAVGGGCDSCKESFREIQQKRIWNQVRVSSSLFTMNRVAIAVFDNRDAVGNLRWTTNNVPQLNLKQNQSSDRFTPSIGKFNVPTGGNSTRRTKTALRPGAMNPGGKGVDVKHNSYARYLAKKKGYMLTKPAEDIQTPYRGNKQRTYNIIDADCAKCQTYTCDVPPPPACPPPILPCNPCGDCCPKPDTDFRVMEKQISCGKTTWGDYNWDTTPSAFINYPFGEVPIARHRGDDRYIKLPCSGNNGSGKYTTIIPTTLNHSWNMCIDDGAMLIIPKNTVFTNEGNIYNAGIIYIKCGGRLDNSCNIINCGNIILEDCCDGSIVPKLNNTTAAARIYGVVGSIQNCQYADAGDGKIDPCPLCSGVNNCGVNCNCYTPLE